VDAKNLLDQLLAAGKELAQQGRDYAEQKLDLPPQGPEREAALSGMGKGALAAGALAVLLGTRAGRQVTGGALKLGSLAAIGGIAYKAFQQWQAGRGAVGAGTPADQLTGPEANARSLLLLKAMIGAAKADGHIDDGERGKIEAQLVRLGGDAELSQFVQAELQKPVSAQDVAAGVDSPAAAAEVYLTSLLAIDADKATERAYLDELAKALNLAPELASELEKQAAAG
jgi:uncharacterized membrane protein YebE (DUF533 family)